MKNYIFFKKYTINNREINIFCTKGNYQLSDFKLGEEGQEIKFFPQEKIALLKIAPIHKEILFDYLKTDSKY